MRRPPTTIWRWRLRHPRRYARAVVPRVVPSQVRSLLSSARGNGGHAHEWGEPGQWLELLRRQVKSDPPPADGRPLVSIVIVAHANRLLTELCVESVLRLTDYPRFEVIVADNGSDDGTADMLRRVSDPRLRLLLRETNAGFARACNEAVALSSGEIICLLNNDVVVTRQWLTDLVDELQEDPHTGAVGPVTNSCGNEARVDVTYRSLEAMLDEARRRRLAHAGEMFEIPMLALYCAAIRRSVWNEIGPLDERFKIGMFEDDDYARRLRQAGYSLICREDVLVHHWGLAAFSLLGQRRYFEIYRANQRLFRRKWRRFT